MKLLEREHLLTQMTELLIGAAQARGQMLLVTGEAGVGKTALLEAFRERHGDAVTFLWGSCDSVVPSRPFAPLVDICDTADDDELRDALDAADRQRVFRSFLAAIRRSRGSPLAVVLEDLHWADGGTLDLIRVITRRLGDLQILVVGTYRSDEVDPSHPLLLALGDAPGGSREEIRVPPLSREAVNILSGGHAVDPRELYSATAGNPFFVTEVLAARTAEVPPAVSDAVAARAARLYPAAQEALNAASVLLAPFELALVMGVAGCEQEALQACIDRGMLSREQDKLRFRHELAQRAIVGRLSLSKAAAFHKRALEILKSSGAEAAVLAHHAIGAGEAKSAAEFATDAAERAVSLGAHREAAKHYATALSFGEEFDERARAEILERRGREMLILDDVEAALSLQDEALAIWRRLEDVRREAECLRGLSLTLWVRGEVPSAVRSAERAVELILSVPAPDVEVARAYATLAQRYFTRGLDDAAAIEAARSALAIADRCGDEEIAAHALTTLGVGEVLTEQDAGWGKLAESVRRARQAGAKAEASRAYINLIEAARDTRRYATVDRYRDEAIQHMRSEDPDHDLYRHRLTGVLAEVALERGDHEEAAGLSRSLLQEEFYAPLVRVRALATLGRVHARLGDGDPQPLLEQALALTGRETEAQDLCPLYTARAEAAWLAGNLEQARIEAAKGLDLALPYATPWWHGELGFYAWKSGAIQELPESSARPFLLHARGDHREAAQAWAEIGCPYYEALALGDSPEEPDLRAALEILRSRGLEPAARHVIRRLRSMGVTSIPRGPRKATRLNPAGLTDRELEVLSLLREHLRNADIAERLVLSPKTVDHHVSSILRKLEVPDRVAAARVAEELDAKDGGS